MNRLFYVTWTLIFVMIITITLLVVTRIPTAVVNKYAPKPHNIEKIITIKVDSIDVQDVQQLPRPQDDFESLRVDGYPVLEQQEGQELRFMTNKGELVIFQE